MKILPTSPSYYYVLPLLGYNKFDLLEEKTLHLAIAMLDDKVAHRFHAPNSPLEA
jgi:hypothetical protein